jgi:apolipoprotein N-acyltransferase
MRSVNHANIVFVLLIEFVVFFIITGSTLVGIIYPQIIGVAIIFFLLLFLIFLLINLLKSKSKKSLSFYFAVLLLAIVAFYHLSVIWLYISTGGVGCYNC